MTSFTVFFCVALLFNICYQILGQAEHGNAKVGEKCERDYNCIKNAFCRAQLTCLCEPNYLPIPDFSVCIATVGLYCKTNEVCEGMSNAECRQNVCACKETFTVDITNSSNCLARPVTENDRCQRNDDCIDNLDRALCINNQCQCLTDHHFTNATGTCVKSAGLFNACQNDYQCHMADEKEDVLECRDGVCKCKPGVTGRHCSGASNNSATMIGIFVFLLLAKFLT